MTTQQDSAVYDREYGEAKAQLGLAKREEERTRADLTEAKLLLERSERFEMRAEKLANDARAKEAGATRKADEAQRRVESARRQGQPRNRLEGELRRWQTDAQRAAQEVRRHEEESRRKHREAREVAKRIGAKNEAVTEKVRVSHSWSQRMAYLASTTGVRLAAVAKQEQDEQAAVPPLEITAEAMAALKTTLDSLQHSPDQVLRLNVGAEDSISLFLDQPREADHTVSHDGVAVLVIEPPVLDGLEGATLEVAHSPNGASLVLSRSSKVAASQPPADTAPN